MPEVVREHFEAGSEEGTVLRLDRPPVNALWVDLLDELRHALQEEIEAGAAAIVLTGSGSCFSAGIDIKASAGATRAQQVAGVRAINDTVLALFAQPVPVVAAVNGHALGGGLVLPLACDLVMATRAPCKLGLNEVAAGVPFPAAALAAPRARLSPPVFNNLCLTGRTFDPEEALALGVVDELCDGDPAARAKEVASALAGFPAYARVKEQVRAPQLAEMRELVANDPMLTSWLA
jgi:enoyl-CoA hydratase